jgi:exosortase/archaeosortase family protein
MKNFLKKQNMKIRIILFLLLTYAAVPFALHLATAGKPIDYRYNFFSITAYALALTVLFIVFNRKTLLHYTQYPPKKFTIICLLLSLASFVFYYQTRFNWTSVLSPNFMLLILLSGIIYLAGIGFLAVAIFGTELFRKTARSLVYSALATALFYLITQLLWSAWRYMAFAVSQLAYILINAFSGTATLSFVESGPVLGADGFSAGIGAPCSGIESISIYIALFLLLVAYEQKNLNPKRTLIVFAAGLLSVFALNILRITALVLIGTVNPSFATGMFHSQAGWALFSALILALLFLFYKWMKKK